MQVKLDKKEAFYQEGTFPVKLHQMLEAVSDTELGDFVSWDPDGLSFSISNPKEFAEQIMGNFFNQTRYKSFQRQLNFYGFHRSCRGKIRGVYTHPMFRRDQPELCNQMKRLDSRDFKKDSTFSRSNRHRKISGLPPREIFINIPAPDFEPFEASSSAPLHQQQQDPQESHSNQLFSLLFPGSNNNTVGFTSSKTMMGMENILQTTQATTVVTNSDCDNNSMGTIDILPTAYPSWETNESFEDDLFRSV